jgi:peptidoglycan/xylan/chitin deacetylase (PgdA/CDA1 family)
MVRSRAVCRLLGLVFVTTVAGTSAAVGADLPQPGTSVSHSGVTGTHSLVDRRKHPGAWLAYDPVTMLARSITARPPLVYAVDATSGIDQQLVGARARLQRRAPGSSAWTTIASSPERRGMATETSSPLHTSVTFPVDATGSLRLQWSISWYSAPNAQTGAATDQVDWYGERIGPWLKIGTAQRAARSSLSGVPAVRVRHGPRKTPSVALTFDFGGRIGDARSIVRWLIETQTPATIFSVGTTAKTPAGTRALSVAAKHPILFDFGNHSETHPDFTKISAAQIKHELDRADRTLKEIVGGSTKPFFRAPYGKIDEPALAAVGKAGWPMSFDWDTTTADYLPVSQGGPTVSELIHEIVSQARPGSIVIMHLGGYSTYRALPGIVRGLRTKGLEPVTLANLLEFNGAGG